LLREDGDQFQMLVISEVMEIPQIALLLQYIDIFPVGARNSAEFICCAKLGKVKKPVCSRRHCGDVENSALAEYIMRAATIRKYVWNENPTFETTLNNDVSAVDHQEAPHLTRPLDRLRNRFARQGSAMPERHCAGADAC